MTEFRVWDEFSKKWIVKNIETNDSIEKILKIAAKLYVSENENEINDILKEYAGR